jgi:membrane-bound lytic murein transglycosylase B
MVAFWAIFTVGCAVKAPVDSGPESETPEIVVPQAKVEPLTSVPAPWSELAGQLVAQGLPRDKVTRFFASQELTYTKAPMEAKLRELFGIFFRSDLTKDIQEKLYQLGYEVLIDGRNGPGTKKAIQAFQKDHNLNQDGKSGDVLAAVLAQWVKKAQVRNLADYKPPAATKPSRSTTYPQFTNPKVLEQIRAHYARDRALFERMAKVYGTPGPLAASIMWIETGYGNFFGKNKAAVVLASMAASENFKLIAPYLGDLASEPGAEDFLREQARQRGQWARNELASLLSYAWSNRLDPILFPGSIYGAIGYGQFMPSNIAKYAVDGDGDGRIDLFEKPDAIFSIGKFLKAHGWLEAKNEEQRRQVIMRYNKSGTYVNTVLYVARALDPTFGLD